MLYSAMVGHLGNQIRLPLAIQNLMLFEEFQDCHHGDTGTEQFSNSASSCHPDASHQVSAQPDLLFGRCGLKNFKMATILDIGTE